MSIRIQPVAAYVFAAIGVPAIYGVLAQLAYSKAPWPSDVYLFSIAAFLVTTGAFLVFCQIQLGLIWRIAISLAYALIVLIPISMVQLFVACRSGDCF
jgi:hypothetical protein